MDFNLGDIIEVTVTGIENYGIFVSVNDEYTGLIHISEIDNNFVKDINDYVKIGETIRAKVISENPRSHQVKLTIKDIDYRITRKKNNKIIETPLGFLTLQKKLNEWVEAKEKQIIDNKN